MMNGVLVVDKPSGKTSFDILRDIKRVLKVRKIGHGGTLDPLATGVLLVCINEATKLLRFFLEDDKEYIADMLLGVETDTLDTDGKVTARAQTLQISEERITEVVAGFCGSIEQTPPKYSALKVRGKPLYAWQRKGVDITPLPRKVTVHRIVVEEIALPYVRLTVQCSKGTYIRSLCSDIGTILGCGACVAGLRRTRSGDFQERDAIVLDDHDDQGKAEILRAGLISMSDALPRFIPVSTPEEVARRIRQGYHPQRDVLHDAWPSFKTGDMLKFLTPANEMVAVGTALCASGSPVPPDEEKQICKILRVFHESC